MKRVLFLLVAAAFVASFPLTAFAGPCSDVDSDGFCDVLDNCTTTANASQFDFDTDFCGNACDADYDQSGLVAIGDFGLFSTCFGTSSGLCEHGEPPAPPVSIADFGVFSLLFSTVPGPSGTTPGTVPCP